MGEFWFRTLGHGSSVLTKKHGELLEHIKYDQPTEDFVEGTVDTDIPVHTTLASVSLGGLHTISSGGRQFWIQNKEYEIDYWPVLGGLPSPDGANRNDILVPPYARIYDDTIEEFLVNAGDVDYTNIVEYSADLILPANFSTQGVTFIPAEEYTGILKYEAYYAINTIHSRLIQSEIKNFVNNPEVDKGELPPLLPDVEFTWWYKTPLDNKSGESMHYHLIKENGEYLKVRPRLLDANTPWRKGWARRFSEIPVAVLPEFVNTDRVIYQGANFFIDSTSERHLTVSPTTTTFTVSDGKGYMHQNSTFIHLGSTTYELNKKEKSYMFLFNGSDWEIFESEIKHAI